MWGAAVKRGYKTGNRNRKLTKLVTIVPYECEITHANYGGDRTTFVTVMAKKLIHPSSRTGAWLPSVLILRGLCKQYTSAHTFVWWGRIKRLVTTPDWEARLAVVGLAWLVETGYWALRVEIIVYLCWLAVKPIGWDVVAKYGTRRIWSLYEVETRRVLLHMIYWRNICGKWVSACRPLRTNRVLYSLSYL